jgi:hypothetical protein
MVKNVGILRMFRVAAMQQGERFVSGGKRFEKNFGNKWMI